MSHVPAACPRCSAPLRAADEVCPFCGHVVSADTQPDATQPPPAQEPPPPPLQEPPPPRSEDVAIVATEPVPWEMWRKLGLFTALWRTWRDSIFRPIRFFRAMPPRGGFGPALGYTVVITAIGFFFGVYWDMVEGVIAGASEGRVPLELAGSLVKLLFGLAFMIPLYVGLIFAVVAVVHVGFLVVGAGRRGYEATFRAIAYASGPAAFAIFPFFGRYLSAVWGMVLIYIAVREAQRTTNGRATLGFLVPLFAFLMFVIFLGFLFQLLISSVDLGGAV